MHTAYTENVALSGELEWHERSVLPFMHLVDVALHLNACNSREKPVQEAGCCRHANHSFSGSPSVGAL